MQITAKVITDSISEAGKRLTTFELRYPRFILAELNTHRAFSRNTASSRAIPFRKFKEAVSTDPAIPVVFPAEQRGMQGGAALDDSAKAEAAWLKARDAAVESAQALADLGVHKSIVNRIIEPFQMITSIVTATEWSGFFEQRLHPDAQPEIHQLAIEMKAAMDASTPHLLVGSSSWHAPYITDSDVDAIWKTEWEEYFDNPIDAVLAVSAARCARVSYETHDGIRDPEKDFDLYFRLKDHKPAHASPFEHIARPIAAAHQEAYLWHQSNFVGWEQYRSILGL